MKKIWILSGALLFLASPLFAATQKIEEIGRLTQIKGKVLRKQIDAYAEAPLKVGDAIWQFDTLRTEKDSAGKVLLIDGSTITLAEGSNLQFTRYLFDAKKNRLQSLFDLFHGKVLASLSPTLKRQSLNFFEIEMNNSVAGVRGSEFIAESNEAEAIVSSIESPTYIQNRRGQITQINPSELLRIKGDQSFSQKESFNSKSAFEKFAAFEKEWRPEPGFVRSNAKEIALASDKLPKPWVRTWRPYEFSSEPLWFPKITSVPKEQRRKHSKIPNDGKITVAIVEFSTPEVYGGDLLARDVTEYLTGVFAERSEFRVVERARMREILAEKKLSEFELVDDPKAAGYFLGVEYLVAGTLTHLGDQFELSARLIDCHSTEVKAAKTVEFKNLKKIGKAAQVVAAELAEKMGVKTGEKPEGAYLKIESKQLDQTLEQVLKSLRRDVDYFEGDVIEVRADQQTVLVAIDEKFSTTGLVPGVRVQFFEEGISQKREMGSGLVVDIDGRDLTVRYQGPAPQMATRVRLDAVSKISLWLAEVKDVEEQDGTLMRIFESRFYEKLLESEVFSKAESAEQADLVLRVEFMGKSGERTLRLMTKDKFSGKAMKPTIIENTGL